MLGGRITRPGLLMITHNRVSLLLVNPSFLVFVGAAGAAGAPREARLKRFLSATTGMNARRRLTRKASPPATGRSMTPQHRSPTRGRSRNERVLRHLPLVRSIVYGLRPRASALDVDDLVSAGTVGLIEAAERYDSRRGVPFASYAYSRVKGAVLDELRRSPQVNHSEAVGNANLSLQAAAPGNQNLTLMDVIPDPLSLEPAVGAEFGELIDAIRCLPHREREMLGLHTAGHTVSEIAERHGCSEPRASQILSQARLRLERQVA